MGIVSSDIVQACVNDSILRDDEKIAWQGRPNALAAAMIGIEKFLLGSLILGPGVLLIMAAIEDDWLFALFGLPLFAIGGFMALRPVLNYQKAGKTYYIVTDQRVLILIAAKIFKVTSILPHEITDYEKKQKSDGTGNIQLRTALTYHNNQYSRFSVSVEFTDGLWGVIDVKGAAEAIERLREPAVPTSIIRPFPILISNHISY